MPAEKRFHLTRPRRGGGEGEAQTSGIVGGRGPGREASPLSQRNKKTFESDAETPFGVGEGRKCGRSAEGGRGKEIARWAHIREKVH